MMDRPYDRLREDYEDVCKQLIELYQKNEQLEQRRDQLINRNRTLTDKVVETKNTLAQVEKERDQLNRKINELVDLYDQQEVINPVTWRSKLDIKINQLRQKSHEGNNNGFIHS